MKFSVFTVMAPDLEPKELISSLEETGYDGVEWRCKQIPEELKGESPSFWGNNFCTISPEISKEELTDLKSWTKKHRINTLSVTPYLESGDLQETERILRIASALEAETIRLGVPRYDRSTNYNQLFEEARIYLSECEQLCKQYGVKGLVETHHYTIAASAGLAYRLVQSFDPDHIGVLYDPGNMVYEGYENYRLGMELLGPYLAHVHAKNAVWRPEDNRKDDETNWEAKWAAMPEGIVNWKQVFKDLKAVGYDGYIGMEDFSGEYNTKAGLKENLNYFKELLNDL